jgi:DNA mismatch repair protein MutS2
MGRKILQRLFSRKYPKVYMHPFMYLCIDFERMNKVTDKTLEDLEFPEIKRLVEKRCATGPGKNLARELHPIREEGALLNSLGRTREFLSSYESENRLPNHGFDSIHEELHMLGIENSLLPVEAFRKFAVLSRLIDDQQRFLKKFNEYYPLLFQWVDKVDFIKEIPESIDRVIDRHGEIRDTASAELSAIRKQMRLVHGKINQSFNAALSRYVQADFLDEIRESVLDNRRVLAVKAMYRRKVKGSVLGTSKTGSIAFIEPDAVMQLSRELQLLRLEEKEELERILRGLGSDIRPFVADLEQYQQVMAGMDLTAAKASLARDLGGSLPEINHEQRIYLREAYHPLLLLSNRLRGEKTWPQTIELNRENRIVVISGPNAGGKSITLKTIGLLQLMLQSGLLIPVGEGSTCCLFDQVLTDIGDNQSIENHLSTYSYRLKNMNRFLRKCDETTLLLIDEFGTGSDPELGGALAETFLETFYERGAYGIITTHYANLKALADELPHASNANMLFNSKTLEPTFQLEMGQPGSSFTFEVAQKNGIPYNLINKAKKKIEGSKIRFDATIAKLQKERNKMAQTGSRLQENERKAHQEAERLEKLNARIKSKLENYQELYDHNQRMIQLGDKVNTAAEKYFVDNKKRPLISELLRIVETENSKRKKTNAKQSKAKRAQKKQVAQELEKKIVKVRQEKKIEKKKEILKEKNKPRPVFKVGDRVRLQDGKAVGSIDTLEKNKAVVNYGMFTTKVSVDQLELVEKGRK